MTVARVGALSGVKPSVARRLETRKIYTTGDLLRTDRVRLAGELPGVEVGDVRAWQQVAELLEVDLMTLARAEGLHAAGVETLDELGGKSLSELRSILTQLRDDGVDVGLASDDQLAALLQDAVLVRSTGVLNGTVVGSKGGAIRAVTVSCAGLKAKTDARGRFRLRRVPLGRPVLVSLAHPRHVPRSIEATQVVPAGVLAGETFRLYRTKAGSGPGITALSELAGDEVPPLGSAPFTSRVQSGAPSKVDLLVVNAIEAGGVVRAVSRLFDFDGTHHVVRVYRVTRDKVRGRTKVGDHLRFVDGKWKPVDLSPSDVIAYRRKLHEQRSWRRLPKNPTAAQVDQALAGWVDARTTPRKGVA